MLKNKDYVGAIQQFGLVIQEDANYEQAKSQRANAVEAYRTQVLVESAECVKNKDYEGAISTLRQALEVLENDSEVTKQINVYAGTYATDCLNQADKLLDNKKFDEAKALLSKAQKLMPDNTKITEKLNSIDGLRPVGLDKLVVIDSDNYSYNSNVFTDSFGNSFNGHHSFNADYNSYAMYNLNKAYTIFSCDIVAGSNMRSKDKVIIAIYVDDTLKYTKTEYAKTSGKISVNIDVSSGSQLTIKVNKDTSGDYSIWNAPIAIVNAQLSK